MSANSRKSRRNRNHSNRRRVAYSLAAGAAAATVGGASADAAVVYSGPQNISIGQFSSQSLNLDGDAYNDILLKNYVFVGGNYQGAYVNFYPGKLVGFTSGLSYVSALGTGDAISSATVGPFQGSMAYGGNNPNAEFNNVTDAYIGLAFPIAAVNHYGWIRVDVDNAAGTFLVKDWAYETQSGVGLAAGDGLPVVPEPGTLGLLAAGAAGVLALRRRRQSR